MKPEEYKIQQGVHKWIIFFTLFFILVMYFFYSTLLNLQKLPSRIDIFDFVILALATFRMIRLFVYDAIFLFLREGLMDKEIITVNDEKRITFVEAKSPLKRTLHKLAVCPWCMGVWISLCSLFVFYLNPNTYFLFLFLAVSSLASLLQILANIIGWNAEYKKIETENLSQQKNL